MHTNEEALKQWNLRILILSFTSKIKFWCNTCSDFFSCLSIWKSLAHKLHLFKFQWSVHQLVSWVGTSRFLYVQTRQWFFGQIHGFTLILIRNLLLWFFILLYIYHVFPVLPITSQLFLLLNPVKGNRNWSFLLILHLVQWHTCTKMYMYIYINQYP